MAKPNGNPVRRFYDDVILGIARSLYLGKVRGRENIPDRPVILAIAPHTSFLDATLLEALLGERNIRYVYRTHSKRYGNGNGKEGLVWRLVDKLAKEIGSIVIQRNSQSRYIPSRNGHTGSRGSIEKIRGEAPEYKQNGYDIGVFPEGGFPKSYGEKRGIRRFAHGAADISIRTKTEVVPVALNGFNFRNLNSARVRIGKPLDPRDYNGRRDEFTKDISDAVKELNGRF